MLMKTRGAQSIHARETIILIHPDRRSDQRKFGQKVD
jgi:hypothetical protein